MTESEAGQRQDPWSQNRPFKRVSSSEGVLAAKKLRPGGAEFADFFERMEECFDRTLPY